MFFFFRFMRCLKSCICELTIPKIFVSSLFSPVKKRNIL